MVAFAGDLRARNKMLFYLGRSRHGPPPPGMRRLVSRPQERDLARIHTRRLVRQHRPLEDARVVLAEGFIGQDKRGKGWDWKARFVASVPTQMVIQVLHQMAQADEPCDLLRGAKAH